MQFFTVGSKEKAARATEAAPEGVDLDDVVTDGNSADDKLNELLGVKNTVNDYLQSAEAQDFWLQYLKGLARSSSRILLGGQGESCDWQTFYKFVLWMDPIDRYAFLQQGGHPNSEPLYRHSGLLCTDLSDFQMFRRHCRHLRWDEHVLMYMCRTSWIENLPHPPTEAHLMDGIKHLEASYGKPVKVTGLNATNKRRLLEQAAHWWKNNVSSQRPSVFAQTRDPDLAPLALIEQTLRLYRPKRGD